MAWSSTSPPTAPSTSTESAAPQTLGRGPDNALALVLFGFLGAGQRQDSRQGDYPRPGGPGLARADQQGQGGGAPDCRPADRGEHQPGGDLHQPQAVDGNREQGDEVHEAPQPGDLPEGQVLVQRAEQ